MARVVLERVSKRYGTAEVVRQVDLSVEDREFVVLIGPSGCGKTTTLRMVAGLEEISSGTVRIGSRIVNDVAAKDRDVAMVFQNYGLYPHMTVFDNMAFGLRMRKVRRADIRSKVLEAARFLAIDDLLERKPRALSGGQRQRVALGRAIVRQPRLFLFDEPLSNLDAQLRVDMRGELKKLHRRLQATIIYVTHDQTEAMTMGDRLVIMKGGIIQQVGAPLDVYERPVNRFVAGFIGSPSMNFVDCSIESRDGRLFFIDGPIAIPVSEERAAALTRRHGARVTLGVRPEDLCIADPGSNPAATIDAVVEAVEPLGHETLLESAAGGARFMVRAGRQVDVQPGQAIRLAVNIDRVHTFDASSGDALV